MPKLSELEIKEIKNIKYLIVLGVPLVWRNSKPMLI